MGSRLNPYIGFAGQAREAMQFYQNVFGGNLTISTFGEFGAPDPAVADQVMHAMLQTEAGYTLMASDIPPGMPHTPGDSVVISLSGDDGDLLKGYWEKLSDGGSVTIPFEKQPWGDEFGQCTDKFGTAWMVDVTAPQA